MKVSELIGVELDYWVAKAQEWKMLDIGDEERSVLVWLNKEGYSADFYVSDTNKVSGTTLPSYTPSTNWQQCGELIDKYLIEIQTSGDGLWLANMWPVADTSSGRPSTSNYLIGAESPLVAICRCVVESKYGNEVE